jgi:peptidoglycan/LPS O-acetylase OafA/YrhL
MAHQKEHIIGLDVLRALAIAAVLFSHTLFFLSPLKSIPVLGFFLDMGIRFSEPMSIMGVELFFVLSGFLIGGILIRQYMQHVSFGKQEVKIFLIKRWFRTLPLYWLILTIDIILYAIPTIQGFQPYKLIYYPFLQNLWYPHPPYFFGEAWSLSVEEWFYLLLPLSLAFAVRFIKVKDKKRFLFRFLLAGCIAGILIRFAHAFSDITDQDSEVRKVVVYRLDALMYGVLFAYWSIFSPHRFRTLAKKSLAIGLLCTAALYYLLSGEGGNITRSEVKWVRFAGDAFLYTALPLTFAMLLPYAAQVREFSSRNCNKFFIFLSRISYSIYLTHYSLLFIPTLYRWNFEHRSITALVYLGYLCIVFGLSYLLYRFVESPFMRLRQSVIERYEHDNTLVKDRQ